MIQIFYRGPNLERVKDKSAADWVAVAGAEMIGDVPIEQFSNLPDRILSFKFAESLQELGYSTETKQAAAGFKPKPGEKPDQNGIYWRTINGARVPLKEGENVNEKIKQLKEPLKDLSKQKLQPEPNYTKIQQEREEYYELWDEGDEYEAEDAFDERIEAAGIEFDTWKDLQLDYFDPSLHTHDIKLLEQKWNSIPFEHRKYVKRLEIAGDATKVTSGWHQPGDDTIHVNVGLEDEGYSTTVLSHELGHSIFDHLVYSHNDRRREDQDLERYNKWKDFILENGPVTDYAQGFFADGVDEHTAIQSILAGEQVHHPRHTSYKYREAEKMLSKWQDIPSEHDYLHDAWKMSYRDAPKEATMEELLAKQQEEIEKATKTMEEEQKAFEMLSDDEKRKLHEERADEIVPTAYLNENFAETYAFMRSPESFGEKTYKYEEFKPKLEKAAAYFRELWPELA